MTAVVIAACAVVLLGVGIFSGGVLAALRTTGTSIDIGAAIVIIGVLALIAGPVIVSVA